VLPVRWDLSPTDAIRLQRQLRGRVRRERLAAARIRRVAGCDVAIAGDRLFAAVLLLELPDLRVIETAAASLPASFPYVPGLLSFREIPVLLEAFARLREIPEAILCDGHGFAHPRRFGLAAHLGVLLDLPTVGCAKSVLIGTHAEPGPLRGDRAPLRDGGEVVGTALRSRDRTRPIYISTGHRVTLGDAVRLVLRCGRGYRLPEPTRLADQHVGKLAREARESRSGSPAATAEPDAPVPAGSAPRRSRRGGAILPVSEPTA